jgi:hypothetical protein
MPLALGRQSRRLQRRRIAVMWALAQRVVKARRSCDRFGLAGSIGDNRDGRVILTNADLTLSPWILSGRIGCEGLLARVGCRKQEFPRPYCH